MDSITYNGETQTLIDEFLEVGYMAEDVLVDDFYKKERLLKRSNKERVMQLFVSTPFSDESIIALDEFLSDVTIDLNCYLILDSEFKDATALKNRIKKLEIFYDKENEYGAMYGTQIVDGTLTQKLTKALFLVGKDGAVYHVDMPNDLSSGFDLERIRVELNKAYVTYTGVGCHG